MSTFTKRIDADIRDVDHTLDGSTWYFDETSAYSLGNPGAVKRNIGLRFTGITIPNSATINSAKITFRGITTATMNVTLKIQGIAEDNTSEFVYSPESSARTRSKTSAQVAWSGNISTTNGSDYDSPDIKTIIQEIVNRAGWSSGNALAIYLSDNGSSSGKYIDMEEYGGTPANAALLTIDYTAGSPSSSVSPSVSPSASQSPSSSVSPSSTPSPSVSPSSSISPSASFSPSSSISRSPSSSASSSVSASASPSPEDYGFKVAKQGIGKNVQDITDPKEYVFTSARGVLGLRQMTTLSGTTNASGDISITQAHSIGYAPITIVTFTPYDGARVLVPTEWHTFYQNGSHQLIETTEIVSFRIDATNIYITLHAEYYNHDLSSGGNIASRSYTFKIYYYFNEITDLV